MKFGAQLKVYRARWDEMEAYIQAMEAGRWNSIWFPDHFLPPVPVAGIPAEQDERNPAYEAFIPLAVTAGMTKRLKLGTLVVGNRYRNPAWWPRWLPRSTRLQGRLILGIGAGWFEREHEAYGWDFPAMKERQDRLEEACALIRKLFTEQEPVDFQGQYYRLERAPLSPGCYQEPHVPIMIGGNGERRPLRTAARYGDIYNYNGWAGMDVEVFKHKRSVLERHCEAIGRDPAEITLTVHYPLRLAETEAERKRILQGTSQPDGGIAKLPHRSGRSVRGCGRRGDVLRHPRPRRRSAAGG